MAEEETSQEDRTEEPTPERREEFREKGQIAVSREVTSVIVLFTSVLFLSFFVPTMVSALKRTFMTLFQQTAHPEISRENILHFGIKVWSDLLIVIVPIFIATGFMAIATTFIQTRFNWSWKRLQPDFGRMNILKGLVRMVSGQALMELAKGVGKMTVVGLVSYLILFGEWARVPGLMNYPVISIWSYFAEITQYLFWAVAALLMLVAGLDYLYNFITLERKLKMTKQEVKEEFKRREVDPHIKARIRRLQRDLAMRKVLASTKDATVLITNPTHYSIALKYELGMQAPKLLAKGADFVALRMREIALESDIPIIENRPLARDLFANVQEGEDIPDRLYRAVAEIIRYVFRVKGRSLERTGAQSNA